MDELTRARTARAEAIREVGSLDAAIAAGTIDARIDVTVSEAIVLGLLRQGLSTYVGVLGHGSTEVGEVLRIYEQHGVCRFFPVRNEVAAAHAAMALRWTANEKAAVITSIGPGALQAFAGSLAAASDGVGVWFLFGDETSEDEGPNMQQIPKHEQGLFLRLCATLGHARSLHTPGALGSVLREGANTVDHPYRPGPFFLLLPMNTQPAMIRAFNLDELPATPRMRPGPVSRGPWIDDAVRAIRSSRRVVIKLGRGASGSTQQLLRFAELADAVLVSTPIATGIVPYSHPRAMCVGGSKGSICGNHAMDEADLVVAVGTRFVCQSDSSRTGYPKAERVITIDPDPRTANHYGKNIPLVGDAAATLSILCEALERAGVSRVESSPWLSACQARKREWEDFKRARYEHPRLHDPMWSREVLTQPAAIKIATDWARAHDAPAFFDAGDVQANGFQIVEDDREGRTFTETGASYMGFAVSALMATAMASTPMYGVALTGDGSFTMNPQILIDGAFHGAKGVIVLLDNRRMAAISGLQTAQYGLAHGTWDEHEVDYLAWARAVRGIRAIDGGTTTDSLRKALDEAHAHAGLSLIHVPVYYGPDPLGGMGAYGRWNVGNWVESTQKLRHDIGL